MWKSVVGYEGLYEVSDEGLVRGVERKSTGTKMPDRIIPAHTMTPVERVTRPGQQGYLVVRLTRNGRGKTVQIHRLVAKAFIPNPLNLPMINHIDGNKHNNKKSNLEWTTCSKNNIHALETGLRKPRGNPILQFTKNGEFIAEYRSTCEAARKTGASRGMISHCINGWAKTGSGYVWKKKSEGQTTIHSGSTREDELPAEAQRSH